MSTPDPMGTQPPLPKSVDPAIDLTLAAASRQAARYEEIYNRHLKFVNILAFYVLTGFFGTAALCLLGYVDLEKNNVSIVAGIIIGHAATMGGMVVTAYFQSQRRQQDRAADAADATAGLERRLMERRVDSVAGPPNPPGTERRSGGDRRQAPATVAGS